MSTPALDVEPLPFTAELWAALGGAPGLEAGIRSSGIGDLPSLYRVTDLAVASIGVAALAAVELAAAITPSSGTDADARVVVDRGLASAWYGSAVRPVGWTAPSVWDPLAHNYRARDGWIRLHTNADHHREAAIGVLGTRPDYFEVNRAVAGWSAGELEDAIIAAGGCAATMRSRDEWAAHPQGSAVADEPLLEWAEGTSGETGGSWHPDPARPLAGLRVLDLTRVIAGPVATRFLAGLGADVLRIDPPDWHENALVANMTLGKRTARLDAGTVDGASKLEELLRGADVLVHGYRDGALDGLGLHAAERQRIRPGLVDVSLDAYGFHGPWASRRGFDSLVQMSIGIASEGMRWAHAQEPTPLPVQALDHSTGYLLAAATLRALTLRASTGVGRSVRTSLARVGEALVAGGTLPADGPILDRPQPSELLATPWGDALVLPPPVTAGAIRFSFDRGPSELGADLPEWGTDGAG